MKKLLFISIMLFFIFACSKYIMYNGIHGDFTKKQIDSILVIEKVSTNLNDDWASLLMYDENNKPIYQYVYIKELNKKSEVVYQIILIDSTFTLNKRIVEQIKKK